MVSRVRIPPGPPLFFKVSVGNSKISQLVMTYLRDFFSRRGCLASILLLISGILACFLFKIESSVVEKYLISNPASYTPFHNIRPYLLAVVSLMPAIAGIIYTGLGILDRYILRKLMRVFTVCLSGFFLIWLLLDLQNNLSDFGSLSENFVLILKYYVIQAPYLVVLMSPFVLLLSCLFVLGQLSTHRELISMIQTGRGLLRVVAPLIGFGVFLSITVSILNFHWAAWGDSYKDGLKDVAKHGSVTRARNTISSHESSGRLWFVGLFPQDSYEGEALKYVEVTLPGAQDIPSQRIRAREATWDKKTKEWTLTDVERVVIGGQDIPTFLPLEKKVIFSDWSETPAQLISPELEADSLGLPELEDWLRVHKEKKWLDQTAYLTQWHSRFSKPWGCLVAVLLAAPLGIVFSRRGAFGGIVTALILCLLLFFTNEIFLAMGEGGYLSPGLAAWAGNVIFLVVAIFLFYRRIQNRPIYQSLRALFALWGGAR